MEERSVSRCVAIASHGRRCQQSPYRGGPYCWHHTQSRKVPATSRRSGPRAVRPTEEGPEAVAGRGVGQEAATWLLRSGGVDRLIDALDPAGVEALAEFADSDEEGTLFIERQENGLTAEVRYLPPLWVRGRRAAHG